MKHPASNVVELQPQTHARLRAIADSEDRSMGEIITDLLDRYEGERFWRQVRAGYRRLREDGEAWEEYAGGGDRYYTEEEERGILAEAAARTP